MTIRIANPIYDVVFKYLMENNLIAIHLLSAILNENIIALEMQPQEMVTNSSAGVRMFKIDFKATIRTKDGGIKIILIEIQKSRNGFGIDRFQTYLGLNYMNPNIIVDEKGKSRDDRYPITVIYFLGFRLPSIKVPVLKVERRYINAISRHKINAKEDFVEKLSHDLYAIQIPRLKMQVKTDLEEMLDVFNQNKYKTNDNHIFEYTGNSTNPKVAGMVKHLGRALVSDPNLLHQILMEEHMEREMRAVEDAIKEKAEAVIAKEEAVIAKEEAQKNTLLWKAKYEELERQVKNNNG